MTWPFWLLAAAAGFALGWWLHPVQAGWRLSREDRETIREYRRWCRERGPGVCCLYDAGSVDAGEEFPAVELRDGDTLRFTGRSTGRD